MGIGTEENLLHLHMDAYGWDIKFPEVMMGWSHASDTSQLPSENKGGSIFCSNNLLP